MDLVTGALGKLPSKLLELLKDEYKLQSSVKDQIKRLSRELESMHAALRKVAKVPPDELDEQVLLWARDVREASYDMEDILDIFLVRVDGDPKDPPDANKVKRLVKKMGSLFSLSKGKARHQIANAVDELSRQLEEVAKLRGRYTVDDIVHKPTTSIDPRLSALYTKVSQLVGIDEQRDKLMQMLTEGDHDMQPNQEVKIVSVVGVGGLGKTTLVKAVYDKLTMNITYKAFVPVGQNPDLKKILRDILIALDRKYYDRIFNLTMLDERQLIEELRDFLKDKRYFIVIDDIWDIESWKIIRNGLDDNGLGSKIVITTRKHDVAKEVGCYYKMEPLSDESSKILFFTRIFGCEDGCPKDLSQVSEKLLNKCGGVPLAIITTSSLLANKPRNTKVWNEVSDSIGSGLGSNHNMDNMRKILSLSYYDLPSPLKTCLLYLSIFPEDYEIEKDRLILRWIAEDFVQQGEESESLFEIGESYFNELLNRSLIQVANTNSDGTPWSCRVHDMVLELICSLSKQENFVTTVLGDSRQRTTASAESKKVRRLSLQNNTAWPTMEMSKLRSIAIFSSAKFNLMMTSLSCCHLLRVLDLQDCNLGDLPNLSFIGNLFHLRYLSLEGTEFSGELPVEMGKLQFLQTLELWDTQINELTSSIIGLRQLIRLWGNGSTRLPNGLRCLTLLEALIEVTVDSACMAEELGHLTQLRRLYVRLGKDKDGRWDENLCAAFVRSLAKLHKINRLVVCSDDVAADLDGSVESLGNLSYLSINQATSLPSWISPAWLPILSNLNITMVPVRTDDIRVLGMLQALRVLRVKVSGEVQVLERFAVSTDAFPCAIRCSFHGFSMAPSVFPHGAMPRLEEFKFPIRLEDYADGKFIGDDLALCHLPSLKRVVVDLTGKDGVSEEVVMEVEEKLRHKADGHPNKPNIKFEKYYF